MTLPEWTPAEQARHCADLLAATRPTYPNRRPPTVQRRRLACLPCRRREHGELCQASGCPCTCRPVLGMAGPFEFGDPTAPVGGDLVEVA